MHDRLNFLKIVPFKHKKVVTYAINKLRYFVCHYLQENIIYVIFADNCEAPIYSLRILPIFRKSAGLELFNRWETTQYRIVHLYLVRNNLFCESPPY